MVYYLKYRPQSLSDLIGQEQVVQTLDKALKQNKLSHAYLFFGPKGVGKTSTARILAKMVNCPKGGCNKCETCLSITDGSNLDLIEIDAASNRGIDDIRSLREKIKLSPSSLKKKVYIIDEVHMLTTEAFNALLKTLEEPPAHVLFILATTEISKIPQTILSRVQRLDFKQASLEDLVKALKKVVEGEKLAVDEEAIKLLAKKGEGSFRDGVKMLDQLSSRGKKITLEVVEDSFKLGKFEAVFELIKSISEKNTQKGLELIQKEVEAGINLKEYLFSLMELVRSLLLIKHGAEDLVKKDLGEEKLKELQILSEKFGSHNLIKILENFQQAFEGLKFASIPRLPLEIALIESNDGGQDTNDKQIEEEKVSENFSKTQQTKELVASHAGKPESLQINSSDLNTIRDKWNYILETIKPFNFSLEAMLRTVVLDRVEEDVVFLKVPYSFHQRILEAPRNRDFLEGVLSDVLGKSVKVGCRLEVRPIRREELANVEIAEDDEVIKIASEIFNS